MAQIHLPEQWTTCFVHPVAPESAVPAFAVLSDVEFETNAFITSVKLFAARGGPAGSWNLSMDLESVEDYVSQLGTARAAGRKIVTWGGTTFFSLLQHYDLSPPLREQIGLVVREQVDLKESVFVAAGSTASGDLERFLAGAISAPPDHQYFPYAAWCSGVRSQQIKAVNFSVDSMKWLSTVWREVAGQYTESTGCANVGTLCSETGVSRAFGHPVPVARRMSEDLQDKIETFI